MSYVELDAARDRFFDESCPECRGDLVELPRGNYSIVECSRGCGWWDEKRPFKICDAARNDDATGIEDRLAAAIKWAENRTPRCDIMRWP